MEKRSKRRKVVAFSLAMSAAMLLPLGASGQGLFGGDAGGGGASLLGRGGSAEVEGTLEHQIFGTNHEGGFTHQYFGADHEGGFTHQSFTSPTGSGFLVLLAAGMGYAVAKRKKVTDKKQKK